jgi:hypothetical protein
LKQQDDPEQQASRQLSHIRVQSLALLELVAQVLQQAEVIHRFLLPHQQIIRAAWERVKVLEVMVLSKALQSVAVPATTANLTLEEK